MSCYCYGNSYGGIATAMALAVSMNEGPVVVAIWVKLWIWL